MINNILIVLFGLTLVLAGKIVCVGVRQDFDKDVNLWATVSFKDGIEGSYEGHCDGAENIEQF